MGFQIASAPLNQNPLQIHAHKLPTALNQWVVLISVERHSQGILLVSSTENISIKLQLRLYDVVEAHYPQRSQKTHGLMRNMWHRLTEVCVLSPHLWGGSWDVGNVAQSSQQP